MNFHEKIHKGLSGIENFFHQYFHHPHYHTQHFFCHAPHINLHHFAKSFPKDFLEELHGMYHQEKEHFLNDHFHFAREYKKLEHDMEILKLDISEHCHLHESNYDKKVIKESLEALRKLRHKMLDMVSKERERYAKFEIETEDKIYQKIHEFLNK